MLHAVFVEVVTARHHFCYFLLRLKGGLTDHTFVLVLGLTAFLPPDDWQLFQNLCVEGLFVCFAVQLSEIFVVESAVKSLAASWWAHSAASIDSASVAGLGWSYYRSPGLLHSLLIAATVALLVA